MIIFKILGLVYYFWLSDCQSQEKNARETYSQNENHNYSNENRKLSKSSPSRGLLIIPGLGRVDRLNTVIYNIKLLVLGDCYVNKFMKTLLCYSCHTYLHISVCIYICVFLYHCKHMYMYEYFKKEEIHNDTIDIYVYLYVLI
jgi:hypothetical protein